MIFTRIKFINIFTFNKLIFSWRSIANTIITITHPTIIFLSIPAPNTWTILRTIICTICITNSTFIYKSNASPRASTILYTIITRVIITNSTFIKISSPIWITTCICTYSIISSANITFIKNSIATANTWTIINIIIIGTNLCDLKKNSLIIYIILKS